MNAVALYGQASASLLLGAGVTLLPIRGHRLAGIVVTLLAWVMAAPFLCSLVGTVSFTLAQLALLRVCAPAHAAIRGRVAAALLVTFAVIFYPLALGLGPFDPFDLGYRPRLLLMLMVPVGTILAWRRENILLVMIGFDLLAYGLGLFENLWSALFDPVLVIVAGIHLARSDARPEVDSSPKKQAGPGCL